MSKFLAIFAVMVVSSNPGQGNVFSRSGTDATEKASHSLQLPPAAAQEPVHTDTLFTLLLNI